MTPEDYVRAWLGKWTNWGVDGARDPLLLGDLADLVRTVRDAVAEEREACARLVEAILRRMEAVEGVKQPDSRIMFEGAVTAMAIRNSIRSRADVQKVNGDADG